MTSDSIPEDFLLVPEEFGFADALQPLYVKEESDGTTFGLNVRAQHLNVLGRVHGGVIMTLGDILIARNLWARFGRKGLPTVAINFSFIRAATEGQWIEAKLRQLEIKKTMAFAQGELASNGRIMATFNATFKLPSDAL